MNARLLLFPFAALYGLVMRVRNLLFDQGILKSVKFNVPVINIGNISTGGTGKTPHIEYLINLLKSQYKVATLSRGYGRKTKGFLEVSRTSLVEECGDEPLQFKNKFPDIIVTVCENRVTGINKLLREYQPDVILLDDAFQHRYVTPSLNILLTEYDFPYFNDYVLPAGNLREGRYAMHRADILIVTKCPNDLSPNDKLRFEERINADKQKQLFFSTIKYLPLVSFNNPEVITEELYSKYNVLMVTGIAHPQPMLAYLKERFMQIDALIYPDHHQFSSAEINDIVQKFNNIAKPAIIVTTEKDYMRLTNQLKSLPLYILPTIMDFTISNKQKFEQYIIDHVKKN
jgi:tetraacyldisaccharide 4'-kinase